MDSTAPKKEARFIQYIQPGLQDGNYSLVVEQTVSTATTPYSHESRFVVQGPRFSLGPDDLVSVFPPPFSLGEYSSVLPHVVLARNTLPWERSLDSGKDANGNDPPWVGVILFNEDDPAPAIQEKTLADLSTGLPPNTYFPSFSLDYGETWSDKCYVIDVPADLFKQLMPTADDLGWLANVREIQLINKTETYVRLLRTSLNDDGNPVGQVAEVVANRFPLPGKKAVAHLVYLEGFGSVLPTSSGQSKLPANTKTVRLVSLKNWTFSTVSQKYTFAGLLQKVNYVGNDFTLNTLQLSFKNPQEPSDAIVANAYNMGLAAFDHTTRLGDKTVSWFHGPFVPYNLQTVVPFPGNVADQFTRYNPNSGMFNVSYSAAWQLGRLLGLQSNTYSTALYNWKRGMTQDVIRSVEQQFLNLNYSEMVDLLKQTLANYVDPLSGNAPVKLSKTQTTPGPISMIKPNRLAAVRKTLTDPTAITAILTQNGSPEVPLAVTKFLARLRLLYGVPFNYLAPDEGMLPPESMRFFYMDSAWVDCLLEGAMSIGNSTSSDAAMSHALSQFAHASANAGARSMRRSVLNMPLLANSPIIPIANPTGFLLRSQVVTGWPGMEIFGYDAAGTKLDFLRLEQVGPGVLLCIFDGVVQTVEIHEHPEALHFGVDVDPDNPSPANFTKSLRYLTAVDGKKPGESIIKDGKPLSIPVPPDLRGNSVLQINQFADDILAALKKAKVYDGSFTSAEFALEMIEGVQQVTFTFAGG